jgi:DNA polymerase-3 subunit alpha
MPSFNHLHVHTKFSLLDGAADISKLYKKAIKDDMRALAITDHGNMFGVFQFVNEAFKHKNEDGTLKIKPIIGCEFYLTEDRHKKQFTREEKDVRYHQLLLAKDEEGYQNLCKLSSLGFIEGFYSKYPRIDRELILKYHKGLIATTCCLGAEVPKAIIKKGEAEAEKVFQWWLNIFQEDYYIELQRHQIEEQEKVNEVLLRWAKKYNVNVIATNDSHYVDQVDANAHDILLCINTGEKQSTPKMKDFNEEGARGSRFAFNNDQYFFKSQAEMNELFKDIPQAIDYTNEIVDKCKTLQLKRDILLPNFPIPDQFKIHTSPQKYNNKELAPDVLNQWEFLRHLTFQGAITRYPIMTAEIEERLNFELETIRNMGFPGYFLIVADFIQAGRDIGVFVGPGRGSAAGSAVAYCIGITNIDPIKYDLLFERFLNPERISMPDIDTDFDDEGRQKVIDYVVDKYGKNQVAQIVTYGTMAARTSIQDVSRVLDYPIPEMNNLKKLLPEKIGLTLNRALFAPIDGSDDSLKEKNGLQSEEIEMIKEFRKVYDGDDIRAKILKEAVLLEGSVRNTGVHAAGIIIAPQDISDLMPVALAKDSDLLLTQYDGSLVEDAGVIKMDFLGLKTLTQIKNALEMIKENHGVDLDIEKIPLDDKKTFELYQRGETNGTFQFESPGMQKHLIDLKPDKFEDLIAMNALYRPGPLKYIPNYIKRKHGQEVIEYDLPEMREYLEETYGITVYQEQVMLLSQKLAGFTKGEADTLRKAMGKKMFETLQKMKQKFIDGATQNGHPEKALLKIWSDWEDFAQYAFNKSHSTCYAYLAFQTAYLKAHYSSEFMAAVLNDAGNIEKITFFMEECKRMGIPVLGPDVNESNLRFSVNNKGEIRFGLTAIKGVGEAAVESIVLERKENGSFSNIYDLVKRISLRSFNRRSMESLALAGAFDSFTDLKREHYLASDTPGSESIYIEKILRWGQNMQGAQQTAQVSLFSDAADVEVPIPPVPKTEPWGKLYELKKEKEVTGFYISGHPLDSFKFDIDRFCNIKSFSLFSDLKKLHQKTVTFAGVVSDAQHRINKNGQGYGIFKLEDFYDVVEFSMFQEDYLKFKHFFNIGEFLYVTGRVQSRYKSEDQFEIKVSKVELLQDVRNTKSKGVSLNIQLESLNEQMITNLHQVIKQYPGSYTLKFKVVDQEKSISVDLMTKNYKVDLSNQLIDDLKKFDQIYLELIK